MGGSSNHTRKIKKRGAGGMSKEDREWIKRIERTSEESYKTFFGQLSNLTEQLSKETTEISDRLVQGYNQSQTQIADLEFASIGLKKQIENNEKILEKCSHHIKSCRHEIKEMKENSPELKLKDLQKKFIKEVVVEYNTPMKRDFNVDFKSIRKILEEITSNLKDHNNKIYDN